MICGPGAGSHCPVRDIVAALRSGDDIAVGGKAQVGGLDRGAAQPQLDGAAADGGHLCPRHQAPGRDQLLIIIINL